MTSEKPTLILLDNGHGEETPGKRSPDGTFLEWEWTRRFARELKSTLEAKGLCAALLVPEDSDVPLRERVRRANAYGPGSILISIHNNAAGDGKQWHKAGGFCAFVAPNASERSKRLAAALTHQARVRGLLGNRWTPPCDYHTASLAMCRDTRCPAVLTENLFMDNRSDLRTLNSREGFDLLLQVHLDALADF